MLHGPFGSPHRPQPPTGGAGVSRGPDAATANTDNCLSSASLLQDGHRAARDAVTMLSNCWPHSRQTYSKMGMELV